MIACEDTRTTRSCSTATGSARARALRRPHRARARRRELVERMRAGEVVALVSDAGMPLVSDRAGCSCRRASRPGSRSRCCPGQRRAGGAGRERACPPTTWRFVGFLPRKAGALRAVFASPEVVVAFESPRRVAATLAALAEVDAERPVAVCRELTKLHEEVVRGSAAELAARYAARRRAGEVVLVIGGAPAAEPSISAPALDASGGWWTQGGRGRGRRRRWWPSSRGERERALSRAHARSSARGPVKTSRAARVRRPGARPSALVPVRPHPVLARTRCALAWLALALRARAACSPSASAPPARHGWRWPRARARWSAPSTSLPSAPSRAGQRRGIDLAGRRALSCSRRAPAV